MKNFRLVVSTPDGNQFEGDVSMLSLRGANGDLAVMSGHIPFVTSVKPCQCRIELADGNEKSIDVNGGILSVSPNSVNLMSGQCKINE